MMAIATFTFDSTSCKNISFNSVWIDVK